MKVLFRMNYLTLTNAMVSNVATRWRGFFQPPPCKNYKGVYVSCKDKGYTIWRIRMEQDPNGGLCNLFFVYFGNMS